MAPHAAGAPVVVAFWHERLPLMPMLWVKARQSAEGRNAGNRAHVLVSHHRDGRFIGAVVSRFALDVVLGSSSRGGAKGLRVLLNLLAGGDHIAITPDGPRGPRRVAAPGVAQLAALSGVPVLPCAAQTTRRWVLRTWDRMVVPKPFGRGVVVCLPTIAVEPRRLAGRGAGDRRGADRGGREGGSAVPRLNPLGAAWAVAATAAAPGLRLMLRVRQARGKEVPGRLAERRGIDATPRPPGRLIWLHAAWVGETMSILPVLPALAEAAPTILLTTGTVTSARLLAQRLDPALAGRVLHRFAPLDVPRLGGAVPRSLAARCGGLRRERAVAEPARRLPGAAHPDDADQRAAVRPQPGAVAARAGAGAAGAGRVRARPAAQRDRRRAAARSGLLPGGRAGRSEARRAAAAGRRGGTAAAAGRCWPGARSGSPPARIRARRRWSSPPIARSRRTIRGC